MRFFTAKFSILVMALMIDFANANCPGKFPNVLSDICWKCVLPINVGGIEINTGERSNFDAPPPTLCSCPAPPPVFVRPGFGLSFWEMTRFVEVVREPFCSPTMGGVNISPLGDKSGVYGGNSDAGVDTGYSFYHVHIFTAPVMDWVGASISSTLCMSPPSMTDALFLSELMLTWNDDETTLLLNPEALLFNNPATILACAADAISATLTGWGIDSLFWCTGSQGSVHPFNGNRAAHHSALDSAISGLHKSLSMQHRLGIAHDTSTSAALCGSSPNPVMRKGQYKFNLLYPAARSSQSRGIGEATWWGAGTEYPYKGEDYGFMLFRKRQCCAL